MSFEEKQGLKIWWLYLITALGIFPALAILIFDQSGPGLSELKRMYFAPLFALLSPFLIIYIIQRNKLKLNINEAGISYQYFPFTKLSMLSWANINRAYIRKYNALSEYGGYGVKVRLCFKFSDKAYLLNDANQGFQLELKNGKKLLFSTNKKDELELFLINLKSKFNIQAIG